MQLNKNDIKKNDKMSFHNCPFQNGVGCGNDIEPLQCTPEWFYQSMLLCLSQTYYMDANLTVISVTSFPQQE